MMSIMARACNSNNKQMYRYEKTWKTNEFRATANNTKSDVNLMTWGHLHQAVILTDFKHVLVIEVHQDVTRIGQTWGCPRLEQPFYSEGLHFTLRRMCMYMYVYVCIYIYICVCVCVSLPLSLSIAIWRDQQSSSYILIYTYHCTVLYCMIIIDSWDLFVVSRIFQISSQFNSLRSQLLTTLCAPHWTSPRLLGSRCTRPQRWNQWLNWLLLSSLTFQWRTWKNPLYHVNK